MKTVWMSLGMLLILPLISCAVPVEQVTGPDGKTAYAMTCSGYYGRSDCFKKAGQLCPSGYKIVDNSSQFAGAVVTQYAVIPASRDYLTVECR